MTEGEEAANSQQAEGQAATGLSHLLLHTTPGVQSGASRRLGYAKGGLSASLSPLISDNFAHPGSPAIFSKPVLNFAGQIFEVGWTYNSPQQPAVDPLQTGGRTYNRSGFLDFVKFFYAVSCRRVTVP